MAIRSFLSNVLLLFSLFSLTYAQAGSGLTNANLTTCGRTCLEQSLVQLNCALGNITCQCPGVYLADVTIPCLQANCTMADTLRLLKVQASECSLPSVSRAGGLVGGSIFISVLVLALGTMRIMRKKLARLLSWDDLLIAVAGVLAIIDVSIVAYIACRGWGTHMWDLEEGQLMFLLRGFFISQAMFPFILSLIKIAILLFYISIFPVQSLHIASWILIAFTALSAVVTFGLSVGECDPVSAYWDKNTKPFTCMRPFVLNAEGAITGIVQDFAIFLLPAWQVWKLQIKKRQKIMVMVMFGLGLIGCIAAIARLVGVISQTEVADPSWSLTDYANWSGVELVMGYTCACLPSVRRLLGHYFPKLLGSTSDRSNFAGPSGPESGAAVELPSRRSRKGSMPVDWDRISDEENILSSDVERQESGRNHVEEIAVRGTTGR